MTIINAGQRFLRERNKWSEFYDHPCFVHGGPFQSVKERQGNQAENVSHTGLRRQRLEVGGETKVAGIYGVWWSRGEMGDQQQ